MVPSRSEVAKPENKGALAPKERRRRLLARLRAQKASCSQSTAEATLKAWGFISKKHKKAAMVWVYEDLTIAYHRPHGKRDMDRGR
jgi:hypothetical protein